MYRIVQFILLLGAVCPVSGQEISKKLESAIAILEKDSQMRSGMVGLYVVDEKTGAIIINRNGTTGMPFASSQKVITSIASLELLGKDFRYRTVLGYNGQIAGDVLDGNLVLSGSGDPTLGSWRYDNTKDQIVFKRWISAIRNAGIRRINGSIVIDNKGWKSQSIPGGWIWDDIGNYYGAGATILNWHENQYDLVLSSGDTIGDSVQIMSINPPLDGITLVNELTAAKVGSGDNAYIYLAPFSTFGYMRGTIPVNQSSFRISGSFPDPYKELIYLLGIELDKQGIKVSDDGKIVRNGNAYTDTLLTLLSPPLDSINYWFLKKSVNLYGEALAKTLGSLKKGEGSTEAGVEIIRSFWKASGVDSTAIKMIDGSGLSPQNRITPQALVQVLEYARHQPYFNSFRNALPEFNGIRMKSGTIGGVKSFTGYVNGYTFAIVVNNYNGSTNEIVRKMYRILDLLK